MKELTAQQIHDKYNDIYVELGQRYDYQKEQWFYEVRRTSKTIRENMTLGQDIETDNAYRR